MNRLLRFYRSSIGKKAVVAGTGILLVGFLLVHMLGNLQIFEGPGEGGQPAKIDQYGQLLRFEPALLWTARVGLLLALILHVVTTLRLAAENRQARPQGYAVRRSQASTLASRTMAVGGLLLLSYAVYHILHFTVGTAHPDLFEHGRVYDNVVRSFSRPEIAVVYLLAMLVLYFHLRHGILSACRTLGANHPEHLQALGRAGALIAALICLGFAAVPLAVLFGAVR